MKGEIKKRRYKHLDEMLKFIDVVEKFFHEYCE